MKRLLINLVVLLIGIGITSCGNKNKDGNISKNDELEIVKKCLIKLNEVRPNGYVVSPRFQNFEFNSFIRENSTGYNYNESKEEILNAAHWTNQHFLNVQEKVNKEYLKKNNSEFLNLAKSPIHNEVVLFSGINENLVFVSIVDYCNAVKVSDLASPSFKKNQRFSSVSCFAFILKDGNVKQMMKDGSLVREYQCNDSDVRIEEK
jgi:hypothetical protein